MRALLTALCALLLVPATAAAGGFATVLVDPPPSGVAAGDTWTAEMTVLQHGVTPMEGIAPVLHVEGGGSFTGAATDEPGVYRAAVTFPRAGEWRYTVSDPFGVEHPFTAVTIRAGAAAGTGGPSPWPALAIAAAAALLFAGLGTLALRRSLSPA